jgi:DNA-binding MarR family transcriptional regulator
MIVILYDQWKPQVTRRHLGASHRQRSSAVDRPITIRFGLDVPPVRRTLGQLVRRVYQIYIAMTADSVTDAGLTPLQYGALACLNKEDGEPGIDQNGLGARLGIDRNSTSKLVDKLEANGLLQRGVNAADRRAKLLSLTQKGEKLFARLHEQNIAAQLRVLEPLAPHEREVLFELLLRVIASNGASARKNAHSEELRTGILYKSKI